jgi:hypothetical protein
MVFSDLWAGRAVKTTLAPKFGGPAQRWAGLALEKEGQGGIPGPPSSPLPPPFPLGPGGGGRGALPAATAGGGRPLGRGGKWGEGGPGLGGGGAWVGSMHHLLPWLPPQRYAKIGSF